MMTLHVEGGWDAILQNPARQRLETEILPAYIAGCRWYRAKAQAVGTVRILDASRPDAAGPGFLLCVVAVASDEGPGEPYILPLAVRDPETDPEVTAATIICHLEGREGRAALVDGLTDVPACRRLLALIASSGEVSTAEGRFRGIPTEALAGTTPSEWESLPVQPGKAEQSNSSVIFGDRHLLKVFRKLEAGLNPDVEIGLFLTRRTSYTHVPRTEGTLEYSRHSGEPFLVGQLLQFLSNDGTGWDHVQEHLRGYYSRVHDDPDLLAPAAAEDRPLEELASTAPPPIVTGLIAEYLPHAAQLGRVTGELHLALASQPDDPDFAPRAMTSGDLETLARDIHQQVSQALATLRSGLGRLDPSTAIVARQVLEEASVLDELLDDLQDLNLNASLIRVHGDYHLGQVLRAGDDFFVIDFEGEPTKSLATRRQRQSPIKDVVGMIRSFDYAAHAALFRFAGDRKEVFEELLPWASAWQSWISATFLRPYLATVANLGLVPSDTEALGRLLRAYLLDKALYELDYELNNRPDWVPIPLQGIHALIKGRREPLPDDLD